MQMFHTTGGSFLPVSYDCPIPQIVQMCFCDLSRSFQTACMFLRFTDGEFTGSSRLEPQQITLDPLFIIILLMNW